MITGLLDLYKISRGDLQIAPLNLSEIAVDICNDLRLANPDRKVEIRIEDNIHAHGDENLIRILLQNLINNAWKFTKEQETAFITFSAEKVNEQIVYFVQDNGVGFNSQMAHKLFAPFHRLHSESEFQGYGIGLATCHKIIQRHDGDIWAEGDTGKGAILKFTLPEPQNVNHQD
jgi:light-regulated signal transduction histidine kinase (bacteriophytochrome)